MCFSVSRNSHIPPARKTYHSLPKDIRCMQSRESYYSHMLPLHNGHHSLPEDGHYSALPNKRLVHMGQYQHPESYISPQPSYPNSLSCPPISVLSRQLVSRESSHAPSRVIWWWKVIIPLRVPMFIYNILGSNSSWDSFYNDINSVSVTIQFFISFCISTLASYR